jgi:agmatinase
VGIRDCCDEEIAFAENDDRIILFFDQHLKEEQFKGANWNTQCEEIIAGLPGNVYISFDVDGLEPKLCPATGTPVPGGLAFSEVNFLFKKIIESGRRIIGFDVSETGNAEWDANVAARLIYKLCTLLG